MSLDIKPLPKFGLIGAGKLVCEFIRLLVKNNFPRPVVFTHKKSIHARDKILLSGNRNYENIFEFCSANNVKLIELKDVNDSESLSLIKSENLHYLFSISSRWIIKEPLIKQFNSNLINIHAGDLPTERGGTTASHRIMNGNNHVGVSLHIIEKGIDSGPLLYKEVAQIRKKRPNQDDMNDIHIKLSLKILNDFIDDLILGKSPKPKMQNQADAFYLPQLYTELNGAINWQWNADQVDKFVRAFGSPFPGAFTFYGNDKLHILDGYPKKVKRELHPFYTGRIVGRDEKGGVEIVTAKGLFVITKATFENKNFPLDKLKVSRILHTPNSILERARVETRTSLKMDLPTVDPI